METKEVKKHYMFDVYLKSDKEFLSPIGHHEHDDPMKFDYKAYADQMPIVVRRYMVTDIVNIEELSVVEYNAPVKK